MCCVPCCSSNYKSQKTPPVSTFLFPKDLHRRQQWLKCIRRGNFVPGNSSVVCINHFSERFIIREHKATRNDGTILIVPRGRPKLTDDAYPSVFEGQPSHLTTFPGPKRKASNGRRKVALDRVVMDVIKTNETEPLTVKNEETVVTDIKAEQNFEDLLLEKKQTVSTDIIKTEHEIDPLASKNDETVVMDMIKKEHEIEPLVSRNDETSLTDVFKSENEIDTLKPKNDDTNRIEEGNRLERNVNEIKVESSDLSYDYDSDIRCEENVVPFPVMKYEIEYSVEKLLSSSLLSKNLKVRIYKTVILPVVLYGCETWTLTLREEHRLRVFENKVLRKISGAKRDEVTGELRKLHNTELHALYTSPDIIRNIKSRRLRWAGHVAHTGESRNAYRVLVGRPEGKRPLGRPRRRWEDNIKMDLREVGYDARD
ncbi:hypothetical protein ANN_00198 [Periplaneta americana]|uniref:THAP-type domain-containing protein n=1 Tax=Periplaneta americana TaxID=6978 RepID=A0ABQ8TRY3_PERAM|nr:hypothetical protein ANN_00198 [Periplaneta americana]